MGSSKEFKIAVLGGTFDHFHKGHKKFLEHGWSVSERLVVGITSDMYVQKLKNQNSILRLRSVQEFKTSRFAKPSARRTIQNSELFESFIVRKKNVEEYLNQNVKGRYEIVKIDDMFGTTLDENFEVDAIIVSKETLKNAKIINIKRKEKNLPPLEIIIQSPVLAEDKKPIASFRIRKGEIDREGKLYVDPDWLSKILYLPQGLRKKLKVPWGEIIKIENLESGNNLSVSVGDETTRVFNRMSIRLSLSVIDFKVARKIKFKDLKELGFLGSEKVYKIKNPAGSVSGKLFKLAADLFENIDYKDHRIIQIDGEEDLSVLPLILTSPLGINIFYGQPGEGIVRIITDEQIKAKIRSMLNKFITRGY